MTKGWNTVKIGRRVGKNETHTAVMSTPNRSAPTVTFKSVGMFRRASLGVNSKRKVEGAGAGGRRRRAESPALDDPG